METQTRRSDRWSSEGPVRRRNWWVPIAALLVVAGYAVAAAVGAAARGDLALDDDVEVVLVGVAPSLGVLGALLAFVGTRRQTLRALAWALFALGVVLLVATILVVAVVVVSLRDLS